MPANVTPQASPLANKLIEIPDADENVCANVTGAAGKLYMVEVDNSGNPAERVYCKLWDNVNPTVGTDSPDLKFYAPAGERKTYAIPDGVDFANGLSLHTVIGVGDSSVVGPTNAVVVRLLTS